MEEYSKTKKHSIKEFIGILNSLGLNILQINLEYYVTTEFECFDPGSGIYEHSVIGKDITTIVENNLENRSMDKFRQKELLNMILSTEDVRRRYHKDFKYVLYTAKF